MRSCRRLIAGVIVGALLLPAPAIAYPSDLDFIGWVHYVLSGGTLSETSGAQQKGLRAKIQLGESTEYPNVEAPWCIKYREVYVDRYNFNTQKWVKAGMDVTNKDGLAKVNMRDRTGKYRARLKAVPATETKPIDCWAVLKPLGRHTHN